MLEPLGCTVLSLDDVSGEHPEPVEDAEYSFWSWTGSMMPQEEVLASQVWKLPTAVGTQPGRR